jgi:type VI secretion system secreted protein VgrG
MSYSQQNSSKDEEVSVWLEGITPVTLLRMKGRERLGRPFSFKMRVVIPGDPWEPTKLLDRQISVQLKTCGSSSREFNGIVGRAACREKRYGPNRQQGGGEDRPQRVLDDSRCYDLTVFPDVWKLTRSSHCRFFNDCRAVEIIKGVLEDYGIECVDECHRNPDSYRKLEYCTQYRETDLAFVSRLMEQEGIYYYFSYKDKKAVLVLADSYESHSSQGGSSNIAFRATPKGSYPNFESIYEWASKSSAFAWTSALMSFDFANAKNSELLYSREGPDNNDMQIADYDCFYRTADDGKRYAKQRIDAQAASAVCVSGRATALSIGPGQLFRRTDMTGGQSGEYLVVAAAYRIRNDLEPAGRDRRPVFDCKFEAIAADNPYRLPLRTHRPTAGLQTAIVVGAEPGKPNTDDDGYGRVQVRFHWERLNGTDGKNNDGQRCWVRVAQQWAGKRWGFMFLPRVGHEVIVAFLDGNPDYPIVVGAVYNSENRPPYTLPSGDAVSTICSYGIGDGDGDLGGEPAKCEARNEMRFNDRDLQLLLYTGGRFDNYVRGDGFTFIGEDEHRIVQGKQFAKVAEQDLTVEKNQIVDVGGKVSLKAGQDIVCQTSTHYLVNCDGVSYLKAGAGVVIESEEKITLKSGGSFITLDPIEGVRISGPEVGLNSGGAAGSGPDGTIDSPAGPKMADDGSLVS